MATTEHADQPTQDVADGDKAALVYPKMWMPRLFDEK
jgi:hypothetical protein